MVVIIGAGISGLSLAWHLQKLGIDPIVLEASHATGGYIKTIKHQECILELGPNSILCDEEILNFLYEVGLKDELAEAQKISKSRYIFKKGSYKKLPENPVSLLLSDFFSASAKTKIFTEFFKKAEDHRDENLQDFFTRRFGKEVADYALNPFIQGIYAGDPSDLLVEETFPMLKKYEKDFGSILKGFIKNKPSRRRSFNFKNGMQSMPRAIAGKIKNIQYSSRVEKIKRERTGYVLGIMQNEKPKIVNCNILVFTTPSFVTSQLLEDIFPEESVRFAAIDYPPMCAIHSAFHKKDVGHSLNGFGGLNPFVENQFSSGSIWNSSAFPNRCPENLVLFTSFAGGSLNADKTLLDEGKIKEEIKTELSRNFNISGNPVFQYLTKIDKAIPQYNRKLKSAKECIPVLEKNNIFISSNYIGGVSLADCIKKGKETADKIYKIASNTVQ